MKEYRSSDYATFKYAKGKTDIFGKMFHDYYELYLLLNGKVDFVNNHIKQTIKPLQLVIIPPGEYHQFIVTENIESYERCVIDVHYGLLEPDFLCTAFQGKELLSLDESDRIAKHFLYLTECLSTANGTDYPHILSAVATDIVFLIKNSTNAQKLWDGNLSPLSLRLISFLDEHYAEPLDLNLLSRRFYCSVSSLCHIFKKDFGISIKKYVIQKRMNASNMALQKGESPEEVCTKYGFLSYSTFYRDYKKYFGISPSETTPRK